MKDKIMNKLEEIIDKYICEPLYNKVELPYQRFLDKTLGEQNTKSPFGLYYDSRYFDE